MDDVSDGQLRGTQHAQAGLMEPVERMMLFEKVGLQLEELILSGRLKPGERLEPEATLAEQFNVSRPVLREALARLRQRGLIETVTGRGSFIQAPTVEHLSDTFFLHLRLAEDDSSEIANIYDVRMALEQRSAQLAAARADETDLEQMRLNLAAMDLARSDRHAWTAADLDFHAAIARASRNPLLLTLLMPLRKAIQASIEETYRTPDAIESARKAHQRIFEAIEAHDEESAGAAMVRHLREAQQYLIDRVAGTSAVPR